MELSFASLFRRSALASLHPRQTLSPSAASPLPEDPWGLKPSARPPAPFLEISHYDDPVLQRTRTAPAALRVLAVRRWLENFPRPPAAPPAQAAALGDLDPLICGVPAISVPRVAAPPDGAPPSSSRPRLLPRKPLAELSRSEWRSWLAHARALRPLFLSLVKAKTLVDADWFAFLGCDRIPSSHDQVHPIHYSSAPTSPSSPPPVRVRGRILNIVNGSDYAVGIAGFVAYLPRNNVSKSLESIIMNDSFNLGFSKHDLSANSPSSSSPRSSINPSPPSSRFANNNIQTPSDMRRTVPIDRSRMHTFYVVTARHDHLGRPEIILSDTKPKGAHDHSDSFSDGIFGSPVSNQFNRSGFNVGGAFASVSTQHTNQPFSSPWWNPSSSSNASPVASFNGFPARPSTPPQHNMTQPTRHHQRFSSPRASPSETTRPLDWATLSPPLHTPSIHVDTVQSGIDTKNLVSDVIRHMK